MKVCVEVLPSHLSQAMYRVASALQKYAPRELEFVLRPEHADLQVLHIISTDQSAQITTKHHAVMQYSCGDGAINNAPGDWAPLWNTAVQIWSYFDLSMLIPAEKFYCAPMGVGVPFTRPYFPRTRDIDVVTSGYLDGPGTEAISPVWQAARGMTVAHIGPRPEGLPQGLDESHVTLFHGITDEVLASLLRRARFVSGLRWLEGFEMMTVEGLACGATPILFDRPDARRWERGAVYVAEKQDGLAEELSMVLRAPWKPTTTTARAYDWELLVPPFWSRILRHIAQNP